MRPIRATLGGTVRGYAVASSIVVGRFSYVAILVFVLVGCLWLEVALRTRVLARPRRLVLTILPVVLVFYLWDAYAISQGHWWFDRERILGIYLPGSVPLDEVLFFVTIPLAAILTLEAVRSVRGWPAGDEGGDGP
ncbi:MAG: lycopene cyclase domain-containing protein [Actinobacteria bacterium]|nr:lycopene cyclase domain-containing protein [Actinomycetota bacterium]